MPSLNFLHLATKSCLHCASSAGLKLPLWKYPWRGQMPLLHLCQVERASFGIIASELMTPRPDGPGDFPSCQLFIKKVCLKSSPWTPNLLHPIWLNNTWIDFTEALKYVEVFS